MTAVKPEARVGVGSVWIWGDNAFKQQADGTTEPGCCRPNWTV